MKVRRDFPFRELIGWEVVEMAGGEAIVSLELNESHLSPIGLAHGGVAFTLLDTAMGAAVYSTLSPGEFPTTIEISVRYLKGVSGGRMRVTGRVVARSGRVAHCEARAQAGDDEVASATGSFLVSRFRGERPTTG